MDVAEMCRILRRDADKTSSGPAAIFWRNVANKLERLNKDAELSDAKPYTTYDELNPY